MKYIKVFYDWPETTQYLKPAQKGDLIDALVRYARGETGIESSLKGAALTLFPSFKRQIDSDAEAYSTQTERNRENGKKGGRPRKEPKETGENPENPVGFSETQKSQDKDKEKDKDKDKEKDEDDTTGTSFPPYLKKIDDNYKHSNRARAAAAQIVVDEIIRARLQPAQDNSLFDHVFEGLSHGLSPQQIFECAQESTYPGEITPLMMWKSGKRWSDENGLS